MTLVSSGDLHMIGSSAAPTRSICYELYGNYTGPRDLTTMASAASLSTPVDITDFYGYSACSDPTPGTIASVSGTGYVGYATITYGTSSNADNYRVQTAISPYTNWQPTTGGGAYDLGSPYSTSLGPGSYRARVAGENCSGLGAYTQSNVFTVT